MEDVKTRPWLWTLLKGQVSNVEAEALGRSPWWSFALVLIVTSVLTAFPFVNEKFLVTVRASNPALYPGLDTVFQELQERSWNLEVVHGQLVAHADVPKEAVLGNWHVVFEPAGGDPNALASALTDATSQRLVFFGRDHFGLLDRARGARLDGTWSKLEGFRTQDLNSGNRARMVPLILYASVTGGLVSTMLGIVVLMFMQVVFLTVVLGFLLSLSKVHASGTPLSRRRGAGFSASVKAAGFVTFGPALITCVVFSLFSSAADVAWVAFSLLFAVRIVLLYTARFRKLAG